MLFKINILQFGRQKKRVTAMVANFYCFNIVPAKYSDQKS